MNNYMVFDIGGSAIKYAVINENGDFLTRGSFPSSPLDFEKFISELLQVTRKNQDKYQISGIALSSPGGVNSDTGIIGGTSALPCIHGPNIKEIIENKSGLPVEIENDANCAALCEVWKGTAVGNNDVLFVVIGSGIGGAVVIDRKIHKGANLHSGEFGNMIMDTVDDINNISFRTWSELAAIGALVRRVAEIKGIDVSNLDGKQVFAAAEAGDRECMNAIDDFYLSLAKGIFNLQYVYDPEKIIIGGAVSSNDNLIKQINKKIDIIMNSLQGAKVRPIIEACKFGNDANLLGALFHYFQCRDIDWKRTMPDTDHETYDRSPA
ncbi:ROK family protein [Bacillus inaquosorum]|uniref:ROK family protein n=1 Tax=Bacillus inaquosorum TaxID=483913 RepID=UPI002280B164|nr:ROK family protein [Bacillus inaquosorum]MCY8054419.1 ROK family protein [Bacillus inaquosorum]MCY9410500.1 ROK family protein [Bacillus inaquosorum]MCY9419047.1 ROK family protein [Bacillus inaquosorum]